MNKSFQESNGTVLSTNWKDIGAKKTECGFADPDSCSICCSDPLFLMLCLS